MSEKTHQLPSKWEFWVVQSNQNYEIESIASFSTIESFWNIYSQFPSIEKMGNGGLSLFKYGIKPAWEDENNLNGFSIRIIKKFDQKDFDELVMLIIGGTSLVVYPAAGMIDYFKGKYLAVLNRDATSRDKQADLCITDPIGEVLGRIRV